MVHHYQKKWVFTWNADNEGNLPRVENLRQELDKLTVEGVFQTERGLETGRLHYQGRFILKGSRQGKKRLLELFRQGLGDIQHLTIQPEVLYDSTQYCVKSETRVDGPWYVGTDSYKQQNQPVEIKLRKWQTQLLEEIERIARSDIRDRVVFWVQDSVGRAGKSTFLKYLCFGNKTWDTYKLPIDKPDRIRMAVCQIVQKQNVDIFAFDFTRTHGEDTSMLNLFQVIEELKNAHITSVMFGQPKQVAFTSPIVIIFTNENFKDYRDYLSHDRWLAFLVSPTGDRNLMQIIPGEHGDHDTFIPIER